MLKRSDLKCGNIIVPYISQDFYMNNIMIISIINYNKFTDSDCDCLFYGISNLCNEMIIREFYVNCCHWHLIC